MSGVRCCRPTRCRPAAVSHSHEIRGEGGSVAAIAGTTTAAAALAFFGGFLESARGGGPLYL